MIRAREEDDELTQPQAQRRRMAEPPAPRVSKWKRKRIASALYRAVLKTDKTISKDDVRNVIRRIDDMDFTYGNNNKFWGRGLYSGRGGYNLLKSTGSFTRGLGRAALGYIGGGLYSGRGDYSTNALIDGGRPVVSMQGTGDETQSICITHTEYLQDVFGAPTSNFYVDSWSINPGLSENFPWLAQIAANYEEYELHQLVYHYKSTVDASAINNTNGSTGTLIMATNYNPTAPPFSNKETMMQYHGANSCRVVDDCSHGVECDPAKNAGTAQKYIRSNPVVVGQDPKTFDLGLFQLAQANLPTAFQNQQIGELWVTYKVVLTKPRLFSSIGSTIPENRYILSTNTTFTELGTVGTSRLLSMQQNVLLGQLTGVTSGFRFTFPDFCTGRFELQIYMEVASLSVNPASTVTTPANGNVTLLTTSFGTGGVSSGDAPTTGFDITVQSTGTTGVSVAGVVCRILQVDVQPVTQGVDNYVQVTWPSVSSATIEQAYVVLRMINASSSQSATNPVPIYINNLGQVTAPN